MNRKAEIASSILPIPIFLSRLLSAVRTVEEQWEVKTYAKMQSIDRMKAVKMKNKGSKAHRRLMTSEARMLREMLLRSRDNRNESSRKYSS